MINVVKPDPSIFLRVAAFVADVAVVNPNDIKTLLANDLNTSSVKGNPDVSNGHKGLPENPSDYPFLLYFYIS